MEMTWLFQIGYRYVYAMIVLLCFIAPIFMSQIEFDDLKTDLFDDPGAAMTAFTLPQDREPAR